MKAIIAPLDFSTIIAYLLPGFISFYSLIYISEKARAIFEAILTRDSQLGAGFLILIVSTIGGVIVSAIRGLVLDPLQEKTGIKKPDFEYSRLAASSVHEAFKDAINNRYRFAQSYGNMSLSFSFLLVSKYVLTRSSICAQITIFILLCATIIGLFICYRSYLKATYETIGNILGGSEGGKDNERKEEG